MKIKKFIYKLIDSNMYIILEKNRAIVIDPCICSESIEYLKGNDVKDIIIIPTHEHYDHISGINWLKESFDNCTVLSSQKCHENMQSPTKNSSKFFWALFIDKAKSLQKEASKVQPFSCKGDKVFELEKRFVWQGHRVTLKETPGHSPGSICIFFDNKYLFTGDTLIMDAQIITKLPGGSKKEYELITKPFLNSLSKDIYIYPGHGRSDYLKAFDTL